MSEPRATVWEQVFGFERLTDERTLKGIRDTVLKLIEMYGEKAEYEFEVGNDGYIFQSLQYLRLETDQERRNRLDCERAYDRAEEARALAADQLERAAYERLHAKYGPKGE